MPKCRKCAPYEIKKLEVVLLNLFFRQRNRGGTSQARSRRTVKKTSTYPALNQACHDNHTTALEKKTCRTQKTDTENIFKLITRFQAVILAESMFQFKCE